MKDSGLFFPVYPGACQYWRNKCDEGV